MKAREAAERKNEVLFDLFIACFRACAPEIILHLLQPERIPFRNGLLRRRAAEQRSKR
jgi:hypothetical protein